LTREAYVPLRRQRYSDGDGAGVADGPPRGGVNRRASPSSRR